MLDDGREYDLRSGLTELLQLVEKIVEFLGAGEDGFEQHGKITCHKVASDNAVLAADKGREFSLIAGVKLQADEGFDVKAELLVIHDSMEAGDVFGIDEPLDSRGDGGGGKKDLTGYFFQWCSGILLENLDDFVIDMVRLFVFHGNPFF